MSEIDAGTISLIANAVLGALIVYLLPHMSKLRKIRDLVLTIIEAADDHKITPEEVEVIMAQIDYLMNE